MSIAKLVIPSMISILGSSDGKNIQPQLDKVSWYKSSFSLFLLA